MVQYNRRHFHSVSFSNAVRLLPRAEVSCVPCRANFLIDTLNLEEQLLITATFKTKTFPVKHQRWSCPGFSRTQSRFPLRGGGSKTNNRHRALTTACSSTINTFLPSLFWQTTWNREPPPHTVWPPYSPECITLSLLGALDGLVKSDRGPGLDEGQTAEVSPISESHYAVCCPLPTDASSGPQGPLTWDSNQ